MDEEQEAKIVLLGDASVGKTSLLRRYTDNTFDVLEPGTVVATLKNNVKFSSDGTTVNFCVWDTAGQENFRSLAPLYFQDAQLALIVFSVIDTNSFESIEYWVEQVKNTENETIIVLCGNKCDLEAERKVTFDSAMELAQKLNANYFDTSAQNGYGVKMAFETSFKEYIKTLQIDTVKSVPIPSPTPIPDPQPKKCC